MYIADPNKIIPKIEEPYDSFLGYIQQSHVWLVQNIECRPSDKVIEQAREYLSSTVGLEIPTILVKKLLDLYPSARISLGGTDDMETQDCSELIFIAAHFFTGCDWPRNKAIEDAFYKVLTKQAAAILQELGYKVTPYKERSEFFRFMRHLLLRRFSLSSLF